MSEFNFKPPCPDCPLMEACGGDARSAYERYLRPMSEDGVDRAKGCKHPWRPAKLGMGMDPTTPQRFILARLISVRGKNPEDYGLLATEARPDFVPTDVELDAIRAYTALFTDAMRCTDADLLEEYVNQLSQHPDISQEIIDAALKMAQLVIKQENETNSS